MMSMLQFTLRHTIPAAYALLPPAMASPAASAMLLAIALQESGCKARMQAGGPALSFWQFERAGVKAVLYHNASAEPILAAIQALCYHTTAVIPMHTAIRHNDVLAACFARCLLWTLPMALPRDGDYEGSWDQYIEAWRPGAAKDAQRRDAARTRWSTNYRVGWAAVTASLRPEEGEV